jgi:hypothetical protein
LVLGAWCFVLGALYASSLPPFGIDSGGDIKNKDQGTKFKVQEYKFQKDLFGSIYPEVPAPTRCKLSFKRPRQNTSYYGKPAFIEKENL